MTGKRSIKVELYRPDMFDEVRDTTTTDAEAHGIHEESHVSSNLET